MEKRHAINVSYHGFDFRITDDYQYLYANNLKSTEFSYYNDDLIDRYGEFGFKYVEVWGGLKGNTRTEPLVIDTKGAIKLIHHLMKYGAYKETGKLNVLLNFLLKNKNVINYTGITDYTYRHPKKSNINWYD